MNDAGTDTAPRPAVEDEDTLPRTEVLDSAAVDTEELPEVPGAGEPADAPDPADLASAGAAPDAVDENEDRHDGLK